MKPFMQLVTWLYQNLSLLVIDRNTTELIFDRLRKCAGFFLMFCPEVTLWLMGR